jgi:hypothetical protein
VEAAPGGGNEELGRGDGVHRILRREADGELALSRSGGSDCCRGAGHGLVFYGHGHGRGDGMSLSQQMLEKFEVFRRVIL